MTTSARGQALVMFSLTIVLVAVMVCLTLGIGMKAREKLELQTVADAAAYSNAVMTARTFNSISLLNRVAVGHMTNAVSTQSMVAYGSAYRVAMKALQVKLEQKVDPLDPDYDCADALCPWCQRWNQIYTDLMTELNRVDAAWSNQDDNAQQHLEDLIDAAGTVITSQTAMHTSLMTHLTGQALPKAIVAKAVQGHKWPTELDAPAEADLVTVREAGGIDPCDVTAPQVICLQGAGTEPGYMAVMGGRLYEFSTNQANLVMALEERLETVLVMPPPTNDVEIQRYEGSSRLVPRQGGGTPNIHDVPGPEGLLAEAMEGEIRLRIDLDPVLYPTCGQRRTQRASFATFIYSSPETNYNDTHVFEWEDRGRNMFTLTEPRPGHAFDPCYDIFGNPIECGVYPPFLDLNPGHVDPGNYLQHLYGQPKNLVVMQRDYGVRCATTPDPDCADVDPWNLFFTARIRPSGATEEFRNTGLVTGPPGNINISRQTVVAAGLAYYHRMGHWKEPPNLFNPYWRATLVSPGIDSQGNPSLGGTDTLQAMQAIQPPASTQFAVDVVTQLQAQGFRGWQ